MIEWTRRQLVGGLFKLLVATLALGAIPEPAEAGPCCYWGSWYAAGGDIYCDCCYPTAPHQAVWYQVFCRDAFDCADNYCGRTECYVQAIVCTGPNCSVCGQYLGSCA